MSHIQALFALIIAAKAPSKRASGFSFLFLFALNRIASNFILVSYRCRAPLSAAPQFRLSLWHLSVSHSVNCARRLRQKHYIYKCQSGSCNHEAFNIFRYSKFPSTQKQKFSLHIQTNFHLLNAIARHEHQFHLAWPFMKTKQAFFGSLENHIIYSLRQI